jgi:hypothetical protein
MDGVAETYHFMRLQLRAKIATAPVAPIATPANLEVVKTLKYEYLSVVVSVKETVTLQ